MLSPLQQQQHESQQRHSQPLFAPPPPCSSPSIVAERARAAAHDALARCSYVGAAFFAEQLAALPGASSSSFSPRGDVLRVDECEQVKREKKRKKQLSFITTLPSIEKLKNSQARRRTTPPCSPTPTSSPATRAAPSRHSSGSRRISSSSSSRGNSFRRAPALTRESGCSRPGAWRRSGGGTTSSTA